MSKTYAHNDESRSLSLDFWGTSVTVYASQDDTDYLEWFFKDHVSKAVSESSIDVALSCKSGIFFEEIGKDTPKQIWVRPTHHDWKLHEEFSLQASSPTPLPPLFFEPLVSETQIYHAAMVSPDGKEGIAIYGNSGAGKTSLALAISSAGGQLITDDILIVERQSGLARPYHRPISFRRAVWSLFPNLIDSARKHGKRRDLPDGSHILHVRPADLPIHLSLNPTPIRTRIQLERSSDLSVRALGPSTFQLLLDPTKHLREACDLAMGAFHASPRQ